MVWGRQTKMSQIRAMEKIQVRAIDMIEDMRLIEYSDKLEILRLPTLSYKRVR